MGLALAVVLATGCSGSGSDGDETTSASVARPKADALAWPAPADPMARTRAAGLTPLTSESLVHHVHAHLDVFIDGTHRTVPAGIGIDTKNPAVKRFDTDDGVAWGGISKPCAQPCISPLHTHDTTGLLHTESPENVDNTLGEFFEEWGVKFDGTCIGTYCRPAVTIAVYVDGKSVELADAPSIPLTDQLEIAVVIGEPPATIPKDINGAGS